MIRFMQIPQLEIKVGPHYIHLSEVTIVDVDPEWITLYVLNGMSERLRKLNVYDLICIASTYDALQITHCTSSALQVKVKPEAIKVKGF